MVKNKHLKGEDQKSTKKDSVQLQRHESFTLNQLNHLNQLLNMDLILQRYRYRTSTYEYIKGSNVWHSAASLTQRSEIFSQGGVGGWNWRNFTTLFRREKWSKIFSKYQYSSLAMGLLYASFKPDYPLRPDDKNRSTSRSLLPWESDWFRPEVVKIHSCTVNLSIRPAWKKYHIFYANSSCFQK